MNESEFLSEKRSIAWLGVRVKVTVRVHLSGEGVRVCPMAARLLPLCAGHGAVEPLEAPALCIEDVGHQVEHLGELREDEDAVAVGLELGQQLAQQDELAW